MENFSTEPVNKERQPEMDMAKAVVIFFLAFIHCTIECTVEKNLASGIPYLFDTVIGGPLAAPVFMFSMGVGMVYAKKSNAKAFARRGVYIEMTGFLLNLCRYTVPFIFGYALTADYEKYIVPILYRTFCNDILQFAGLALLLMALLQWMKISDRILFVIALGMSGVSIFLNGVDIGNPAGNILLGYFIGIEDAAGMVFSDFPLLNWFIVLVSGYVFGKCLIRVKDKKKFYLTVSPTCLIFAILYFWRGIKMETGMFGEGQNCYYHIKTPDVLVSIAAIIGMLGVYYLVVKWVPERWMYWIQDISRNVTMIYCVHWVMVVFATNIFLYIVRGTQELTVPATMLLSFVISIAAIFVSHFWSKRVGTKKVEGGSKN